MFGWFQKKDTSGAANLAALFNSAGDGGIENFANMLNGMGEAGGTKLASLFNGLDERGTANYSAFLNDASAAESSAFSAWIEKAGAGEIDGLCSVLNRTPRSGAGKLKDAIVQYTGLRNAAMGRAKRPPLYATVKSAVVGGRIADLAKALDDGFDLASRNEHGEVILLHAVCMGDARLAVTELLLRRGADANAVVGGKTIVEFIRDPAYCDHARTMELLQHGARDGASPPQAEGGVIRFACGHCGKKLKTDAKDAGRKAACHKCGTKMTVPHPLNPVQEPPSELATALAGLRSADFDERVEALAKLRALKDPAAVEPLIGYLADGDSRMRQETAYTLESLGDARAVMPLIAALVDLDGDVRLKVARALGVLKDKRAVDPLCVHLRDPDNVVRFYAAQALGQIGDPTALPALRTALERTPHEGAHRAIAAAIAELAPPPPPPPPPEPPRPVRPAPMASRHTCDVCYKSFVAEPGAMAPLMLALGGIMPNMNQAVAYCTSGMKCNRCASWVCAACAQNAALSAGAGMLRHTGCGGMYENP